MKLTLPSWPLLFALSPWFSCGFGQNAALKSKGKLPIKYMNFVFHSYACVVNNDISVILFKASAQYIVDVFIIWLVLCHTQEYFTWTLPDCGLEEIHKHLLKFRFNTFSIFEDVTVDINLNIVFPDYTIQCLCIFMQFNAIPWFRRSNKWTGKQTYTISYRRICIRPISVLNFSSKEMKHSYLLLQWIAWTYYCTDRHHLFWTVGGSFHCITMTNIINKYIVDMYHMGWAICYGHVLTGVGKFV